MILSKRKLFHSFTQKIFNRVLWCTEFLFRCSPMYVFPFIVLWYHIQEITTKSHVIKLLSCVLLRVLWLSSYVLVFCPHCVGSWVWYKGSTQLRSFACWEPVSPTALIPPSWMVCLESDSGPCFLICNISHFSLVENWVPFKDKHKKLGRFIQITNHGLFPLRQENQTLERMRLFIIQHVTFYKT